MPPKVKPEPKKKPESNLSAPLANSHPHQPCKHIQRHQQFITANWTKSHLQKKSAEGRGKSLPMLRACQTVQHEPGENKEEKPPKKGGK